MPESPNIPNQPYDRGADFGDNGYANLDVKPWQPRISVPNEQAPTEGADPNNILDHIFGNLSKTTQAANPFIGSLDYTMPVKTPLAQTVRYDSPTYGFSPFDSNIEQHYGDRQSAAVKWKNNFLKFLATTTGSLVEGLATVPQLLENGGDFTKLYKTDLATSLNDWLTNLEDTLPNYQTTFGKNHAILDWIPFVGHSGDTWGGLLKNLGFTTGAIASSLIQDALVGAVTGGIGEAPLLPEQLRKIGASLGRLGWVYTHPGGSTKLLAAVEHGEDITEVINSLYKSRKAVDEFRYGLSIGTSALAESTFEANQTYKNLQRDLGNDFYEKYGRAPTAEESNTMEDYAKGGGNASMITNAALLTLTNSIVFGSVLKPFNSAQKAVARGIIKEGKIQLQKGSLDVYEKVANEASKFKILQSAGKAARVISTTGTEAFEEGVQFVTDRTANNFYRRKMDDKAITEVDNWNRSFSKGMHDVFFTREGIESMVMGALTGGLIHLAKRVGEKRRGIVNDHDALLESTLKNMNSVGLSNLFNNKEEAVVSVSLQRQMEKAVQDEDVFEYYNLKFQQLFNYIHSGIRAGHHELRMQQLDLLKSVSKQDFERMFGMEFNDANRRTVEDFVDGLHEEAMAMKENIDKVETIFKNPFKNVNTAKDAGVHDYMNHIAFEEYKKQMALNLSEIDNNRRRYESLTDRMNKAAPGIDNDQIIRLTNDQGLEEAIAEMKDKIKGLYENEELLKKEPNHQAYKDAVKERKALEFMVDELSNNRNLGYYDNIYDVIGNILNYWANGNKPGPGMHVNPIDLLPLLRNAQDAFRLINASNAALYHYHRLSTKQGMSAYIAQVLNESDKEGPPAPPDGQGAPPPPNDPDAVDIDANGNVKTPPASTPKGQAETKKAEAKNEKADQKVQEKAQKVAEAEAKVREAEAKAAAAQPAAPQGPAQAAAPGAQAATPAQPNAEVEKLKAELEAAKKELAEEHERAQQAKQASGVMSVSSTEAQTEQEFNPEEEDDKIESKKNARKSALGRLKDSIFKMLDPFIRFNKIYSRDHSQRNGQNEIENMWHALFSMPPRELYKKMTLEVSEATEGQKHGHFIQEKATSLYYQGYAHDINIVVDGKVIGKIQPADRNAFKRGEQYLPLWEMTKDEYARITQNPVDTYDRFMEVLNQYRAIHDQIMKQYKAGKTKFSNADVQNLFDIKVWYGGAHHSRSGGSSTLIKDLRYRTKGDALLSFQMVYNPVTKQMERSRKPTLLNEKEISDENRQKLWNFVADNLDQLRGVDSNGKSDGGSRYVYVFQLPDGTYQKISPIYARPVQANGGVLKELFKRIQDADQKSKDAIAKLNQDLRNQLYITDANNRKGTGTNMFLSISKDGDLLFNVVNDKASFYRAYKVNQAKDAQDFEGAVDTINQIMKTKARADRGLDGLNISLDAKDFKTSIPQDENVTMAGVESSLSLATTPTVFEKFGMGIVPLGTTTAVTDPAGNTIVKTSPKPKRVKPQESMSEPERELLQALNINIDRIQGPDKVGIAQALKDPSAHPALIKTIVDQFMDNPNAARVVYGNNITEKILKIVGGRLVADRRSLQFALQEIFKLNAEQALQVSNVYDRIAKVWAERHGKEKGDFYANLMFMKGTDTKLAAGSIMQEDTNENKFDDATTDLIDQFINNFSLNQKDGGTVARAAIQIAKDGKAVIYALTDPNVSSPLHELAHYFEPSLTEEERKTVLDWAGHEKWGVDTSEAFARGFERYLAEGKAESKSLKSIFDYFKKWLTEIYKGIVGSDIDVKLNDPMRKLYAEMLGDTFKTEVKKEVAKEKAAQPKPKKIVTAQPKPVENLPSEDESKAKVEQQATTKGEADKETTAPKKRYRNIYLPEALELKEGDVVLFKNKNGKLQKITVAGVDAHKTMEGRIVDATVRIKTAGGDVLHLALSKLYVDKDAAKKTAEQSETETQANPLTINDVIVYDSPVDPTAKRINTKDHQMIGEVYQHEGVWYNKATDDEIPIGLTQDEAVQHILNLHNGESQQSESQVAEEATQEEPAASGAAITESGQEETSQQTAVQSGTPEEELTEQDKRELLFELDDLNRELEGTEKKKGMMDEREALIDRQEKGEDVSTKMAEIEAKIEKRRARIADISEKLYGTRPVTFEEALEEHLQEDGVTTAQPAEVKEYNQGDKVMYQGKQWEVMGVFETPGGQRVYDLFADRRGTAEEISGEELTPVMDEVEEAVANEQYGREQEYPKMGINEEGENNTDFIKGENVVFGDRLAKVVSTRRGKEAEGTRGTFVTIKFQDGTEKEVQDVALLKHVRNDDSTNLTESGLMYILDRLQKRFGIPYETVHAPEEDWKGRFTNGTVWINLAKVSKDTPFHEYMHPFIAALEIDNPAMYEALVKQLQALVNDKDERALRILRAIGKDPHYKKMSLKEMTDEALVQYIGELASENINKQGKIVSSKLVAGMARLIAKFGKWLMEIWQQINYHQGSAKFRFMKLNQYTNEEVKSNRNIISFLTEKYSKKGDGKWSGNEVFDVTMQDLADILSLTNIHFDLSDRKDLFEKLDQFQAASNTNETLSDEGRIIKNLKRRLQVLEDTAKRRIPSEELLDEARSVRNILANEDETESLLRFVDRGIKGLSWAADEFNRITASLKDDEVKKTPKKIAELNRTLDTVKSLLGFYLSDVHYLLKGQLADDKISDKDAAHYNKVIRRAEAASEQIRSRSVDLMVDWLFPYFEKAIVNIKDKYPEYTLTKDQFRNKMFAADRDIDRLFFLLGSVGSSNDVVSAILRDALFDVHEQTVMEDAEIRNNIILAYEDFLKRTGLSNDREKTGEYYKKHFLRKAKVLEITKFEENPDTGRKEPKWEYVDRWAFHEEYFYDLYVKEYNDYIASLGEQPSIADEAAYQDYANKLIAWEKVNGSLSNMAERFRNPEFEKAMKDPMFKVLYETYKNGNDKLPKGDRLQYGTIPQVSRGRNMFSDMKWSGETAKDIGKKAGEFIAPTFDRDWTDHMENLDGSSYKKIKMAYIRPVEEQDLDFALPETVFKYAESANLNEKLREIEPNIHTMRTLLAGDSKFVAKARQVNQVANGKTVFDSVSGLPASKEERKVLLNKQLIAFIDDVVYGEESVPDSIKVLGREIDMNQWGANMSFLTALNNMAFNVNAMFNNVIIGNIQSIGESVGGKYYKGKNWRKGSGQYNGALFSGDFIKDTMSLRKSKITQLGIKYDAIQGEFRDKYGKRFVGSVAQKYATLDTLFVLTHAAEHQIQLTGMLALMDATEVTDNKGNKMSLFDAHFIDEKGRLQLRKDVIWSKDDEFAFTKRLHAINQILNGNYSKFDKAYIQRKWYGKLALVYRKYLYNGFRARYGKQRVDYALGDVTEGYYRTFFKKIATDVKNYKFDAAARLFTRRGWNADERYAYNKTVYELGILIGVTVLGIALGAGNDKDKKDKSWGQNYLSLMLLRTRSDMGTYSMFGLQDAFKLVKNPSAVVMTLSKYADFFQQLFQDPFAEYKRRTGVFDKGESVLKAKLLKAIPILRQFINLMTPEEQAKFYTLTNKAFNNN